MSTLAGLRQSLADLANPAHRAALQRFFKTGPGQYGEGDEFLGIKVPVLRQLAKRHRDLPLADATALLRDRLHEHRMLALLLLIQHYQAGAREVFELYLAHTRYIDNWDLVDVSAPAIVGAHLLGQPRDILHSLAASASLWERRIAIVATLALIRQGEFAETLLISERLLPDRQDLIHKACGWMLREVGKREVSALEGFLNRHAENMPRTMLRYAIERLPPAQRRAYLARGK